MGSVMIVAGEASADLHGAALVAELKRRMPDLSLWGAGGDAMVERGFEAVVPAQALAVAGLTEVLLALPRLLGAMRHLVDLGRTRLPDVIVLIDLPDFNLRLAKRLKGLGIPIVYYVSPQLWAWRPRRVRQIRQRISKMLCILPFEIPFYRRHNVPAQFVGHPLVELLRNPPERQQARRGLGLDEGFGPVLALLPGSRYKEVSRHLPIMLDGVGILRHRFPDLQVVIPAANTIPHQLVEQLVQASGVEAQITQGQATECLAAADVAVVCSGTATLQAALVGRPMVVVYRVSWLTFFILKRLVKVAYIALVNLVAGRRLVPELIQSQFTAKAVDTEVGVLLSDSAARVRLATELRSLRDDLDGGDPAVHVANVVCHYLKTAKA
ncbi:MAG: lipid-A-disaccharide synthase [Myxococcota bacterium]